MRQLQNTQAQTLEIEKQRLAMERERLDFEKSAVERFFQTMPMFFAQQMQSNLSAQQTPAQLIPTLFTPVSQQMRINPPKLVFATASGLPNGATTIIGNPNTNMQTVTMPANCAMMSNSLPKVLTNSSQTTTVELGDMQMMPKIEVDD